MLKKYSQFLKDNNMKVIRSGKDSDSSSLMSFSNIYQPDGKLEAKIIEGKNFETMQVKHEADESGFKFFIDGIERTKVLAYHPSRFVPVIYGYISAVILEREYKKLATTGLEISEHNIYLPYIANGDEPENYFRLEDFTKYGFQPFNTGTKNKESSSYPVLPLEFEQRAHSAIQEERRKMERDLAKQWLKKYNDGWLFIDGRLEPLSNDLKSDSKVAGIIKSHHVSYFEYKDQLKIYNLKKGERSCVFQPQKKDEKTENVFSWYLRLHNGRNKGNVDFGIIRVEIPAKYELLNLVDRISSWILLETKPVAFPASRWDRMIYPIKYCEDYLKSKAPSWAKIESLS